MAEKKEPKIETAGEGVEEFAGIELPEPDLAPVEPPAEPVEPVTEPKRQRKPRRPKGAAKKGTDLAVEAWTEKVVGLHMLAAKLAGTDVLVIDNHQARALTEAVLDVVQHYDLHVDPKLMAWINLGSIAAMIYTPKIMAITVQRAERKKRERAQRTAAAAAQASSAESSIMEQPGVVTFPSING